MAAVTLNLPDEFQKQLERLSNIDEIAPKMIEAASPIVIAEMKRQLAKHDRTGQLSKSVKAKKTAYSKKHGGHYTVVRPTGNSKTYIDESGKLWIRSKPERNMEKLATLEYGKTGQAATPVVGDIISATENAVVEAMQKVYEQEMKL